MGFSVVWEFGDLILISACSGLEFANFVVYWFGVLVVCVGLIFWFGF